MEPKAPVHTNQSHNLRHAEVPGYNISNVFVTGYGGVSLPGMTQHFVARDPTNNAEYLCGGSPNDRHFSGCVPLDIDHRPVCSRADAKKLVPMVAASEVTIAHPILSTCTPDLDRHAWDGSLPTPTH
jgi:hypothetical protein